MILFSFSESLFTEYEHLIVKADAYHQNGLDISTFLHKKMLKEYLNPPVKGVLSGMQKNIPFLTSINAIYDPLTNKLAVPIGIANPPIYWSQPKSLTFGGIGQSIGM